MARLQASVQLDPHRAPEQLEFLHERVQVLREAGGMLWVSLEENQLDALIAHGMVVTPHPEAGAVELPALTFHPESEPSEPPAALRAEDPSAEATGDYLVTFQAPIDQAWLQEIATVGGELLQALPSHAAVFRFTRDEAEAVSHLGYVTSVGAFHPAYTVSFDLAGATEPFTASSLRGLQVTLPPDDPDGNLSLRFFDGVDPEERRAAVEAAGATIVHDTAHGFVVRAPQARVNDLLRISGLFAAGRPTRLEPVNNNAGVILGANQVCLVGTVNFLVNLDGTGEVAAMVDTGCDVGDLTGAELPSTREMTAFHPDLFANVRLIRHSKDPWNKKGVAPDGRPHGTHVAGTICGDGTSSDGKVRGIAPGAALIVLGSDPLVRGFPRLFDFAFRNGARVINGSLGNYYEGDCTDNRYLPDYALAVDGWCCNHPDALVLFGAGNEEADWIGGSDGKLDALTLRLEAVAKNVFTVGASENLRNNGGWQDSYRDFYALLKHPRYGEAAFKGIADGAPGAYSMSDQHDEVALFSCRGTVRASNLTDTGRVKPDIVAPGTNVLSLRSQWVSGPPGLPNTPPALSAAMSTLPTGLDPKLYMIMHGTSMATPMVSGSALLVRQYFRTRFAQMRRPLLLEGVALPAAPPLSEFTGIPSIATHADGLVFAWCRPAPPGTQKQIMAMRLSRSLAPQDAAPLLLQVNVGDHPALKVATLGERTYLLHRHSDNTMRLSCYDRNLQPVSRFGTGGVVTLTRNARPDDNITPDLLVAGEHVICAFPPAGGNDYVLQRFRADTGAAVDPAPVSLFPNDNTGPHSSVAQTGSRYTVCGVAHPGNYQLQVRQMGDDGALMGTGPTVLVDQPHEIREPCLIWNGRLGRYVLVWCDARTTAGGDIYLLLLDADGAAVGSPHLVVPVPPAHHLRRPRILAHPEWGHFLIWEDDSQGQRYDVYVTFLDHNGEVDGRVRTDANDPLTRSLIRVSDTPENTAGFAAFSDADGLALVFQSPDEINSDQVGTYAVNLTPGGAFGAQKDPSTPLLKSGRYTTVDLPGGRALGYSPLSAVWAGGCSYLLRVVAGSSDQDELQWIRLTADGVPDTAFGPDGIRTAPVSFVLTGCQAVWTGSVLLTAGNDMTGGITIYRHDHLGKPVAAFGAGGSVTLQDSKPINEEVTPQLGWKPVDAAGARIVVAYGTNQAGILQLRYQRLDETGVRQGDPMDLAAVSGVARHNWFHFVAGEKSSIAIYHRISGAVTRVHTRRFTEAGPPSIHEHDLSAVSGEGINGTIAWRPATARSPRSEYGAVWQYRTNDAARWEIRFSRLNMVGQPRTNPPAPTPPGLASLPVSDVPVIAAGSDWPADRDAVEPQLVSTHTHWPWADQPATGTGLPEWSPSYGLAWLGVLPDGSRVLFFTVLDENGRRIMVSTPPPSGPGPLSPPTVAPILQVTANDSKVKNYKLFWNGRIFLLYWAEEIGGSLQYKFTAVNRHANRRGYDIPSAALLRATLVNGATNMQRTSLPDAALGYGWGRVNLRQSLAPAPPVTMHVRDDCAIGPGRMATYRFALPAGTAMLRVTLNWTDPPGAAIVNPLHLTVRAPAVDPKARPEYRGNLWHPAAGKRHLSRPVADPPVAADNHEDTQTFKQVVIENPPPGDYNVEVSAGVFPAGTFNQQNLQAFALVFAGTGPEVRFTQPVVTVQGVDVF